MRKLSMSASLLCTVAVLHAQDVVWQKDIKSSTQDFLSQVTTTIDQQYLITGSSIQARPFGSAQGPKGSAAQGTQGTQGSSAEGSATSKQNNGYDFHLVKLNQQGEEVWEKYFSGQNHDFLSATVATQEGGFLLAGTSFSNAGLDKKDNSKGGSDIWLIRINEFGDELWQKTLGSSSDEEAKAVIQTTDFGFFVAGTIQNAPKGFGSKDVIISKLDKNGKELSQIILGGRGLDEIEKMIPTLDGGALLGIYSRSGIVGNEKLKQNSEKSSGYSKKSENFGEGDFWVVKLNKEGKVEWEKNFGGKGDDHLRTLAMTSTGYVVGGESRSERSGNKTVGIEEGTDLWLISLNDRGEEQWQKSYNFKNRDVLMGMNVVSGKPSTDNRQPSTKGILVGGYTQAKKELRQTMRPFGYCIWIKMVMSSGENT